MKLTLKCQDSAEAHPLGILHELWGGRVGQVEVSKGMLWSCSQSPVSPKFFKYENLHVIIIKFASSKLKKSHCISRDFFK